MYLCEGPELDQDTLLRIERAEKIAQHQVELEHRTSVLLTSFGQMMKSLSLD